MGIHATHIYADGIRGIDAYRDHVEIRCGDGATDAIHIPMPAHIAAALQEVFGMCTGTDVSQHAFVEALVAWRVSPDPETLSALILAMSEMVALNSPVTGNDRLAGFIPAYKGAL